MLPQWSDSGESVSFIEKSDNSPVSMEILVMLPMPLVKKMLVLSDMSEISKAQSKFAIFSAWSLWSNVSKLWLK